jgi:hypothetical protein
MTLPKFKFPVKIVMDPGWLKSGSSILAQSGSGFNCEKEFKQNIKSQSNLLENNFFNNFHTF